jgi:Transposase DDE domain
VPWRWPRVVADAKYGTALNYWYLDYAGITAFIPSTRFGHPHTGIWGREHFTWLPDEDAVLCPAGERLKRAEERLASHRIRYQAPAGSCLNCQFRSQCAPSGRSRSLHRQLVQDLVDAATERAASPLGKQRPRERQVRAEGTFALAKELHGLRRTRFRGRSRVQIQLWLTAAAMNIKRAVMTGTKETSRPATATRRRYQIRFYLRGLTSLSARSRRRAFGNNPGTSCELHRATSAVDLLSVPGERAHTHNRTNTVRIRFLYDSAIRFAMATEFAGKPELQVRRLVEPRCAPDASGLVHWGVGLSPRVGFAPA